MRCLDVISKTCNYSFNDNSEKVSINNTYLKGPTYLLITFQSMRSRKPVNYSFEDLEVEDADDSFDQTNKTDLPGEVVKEKPSCMDDAHVDGFSGGNESGMIEIPLKDNLPTDYLEPEIDAGAATSMTRPSDDYLEIGGGFCVDDSEMDNNHDAVDDMNTAAANSTPCSEFLDETDRDKSSPDILFSGAEKATGEIQDGGTSKIFNKVPNDQLLNADIGVLIPENAHNSESSKVAFSAMPFLRKKRKK
jgi:DNA excision repair protein ERCC-5